MQYCPKCKVNIRGKKKCCPLCQGQVREVEGDLPASFPTVKKKKISNITLFKMSTFLFIAAEIVFGMIHVQTGKQYPFVGIVNIGLAVAWITVITTLYLRNNLIKVITWEAVVAIVVDIFIDMKTGFFGWSVMWVVPSTLLVLVVLTVIIARAVKLRLDEYILYLVLDLIMALMQLIFIRLGMNRFTWPAVISIMIYLIIITGLVIFRFGDLKHAAQKLFNM